MLMSLSLGLVLSTSQAIKFVRGIIFEELRDALEYCGLTSINRQHIVTFKVANLSSNVG